MYSKIAGTGAASASSGSQMRAAKWQPSNSGIQQFSITCTLRGNDVTTFMATLPTLAGNNLEYFLEEQADLGAYHTIEAEVLSYPSRAPDSVSSVALKGINPARTSNGSPTPLCDL